MTPPVVPWRSQALVSGRLSSGTLHLGSVPWPLVMLGWPELLLVPGLPRSSSYSSAHTHRLDLGLSFWNSRRLLSPFWSGGCPLLPFTFQGIGVRKVVSQPLLSQVAPGALARGWGITRASALPPVWDATSRGDPQLV